MKKYFSLLLFILFTPFALYADDHSPEVIADAWVMVPKAGHEDKFEAGLKEHLAHRKANGDKRTWGTWRAVTGSDLGEYIVRSCCDTWAAQDEAVKVGEKLNEHFDKTVAPHVDHYEHNFSAIDSKNSNWGENTKANMVGVTTYWTEPGTIGLRNETMKKMSDLAKDKGWTRNWSWSYPIGGKSRWSLVTPFENYAAMAPMEEGFYDFAVKHMGQEETDKMFADWSKTFKGTSYTIYRHVKSLSTPKD